MATILENRAYVPLDPAYPSERLGFMIEDAQAPVVLTETDALGRVRHGDAETIYLDRDHGVIAAQPTTRVDAGVAPGDLAYIIYTSGSTGRPKGVAIAHQSAATLIHWASEAFTREQLARVLASTSICFDLSVFELFVPLSTGGAAVLVENALALASLADGNVTLINTVPSAMAELLRLKAVPGSTRVVNLAGEPLPTELVSRLYRETRVESVFNLYGPTEDTTYSTGTLVPKDAARITIGRPLPNTQVYILGQHQELVPIGVPGELYIGGAGLARGYWRRPELTAEKFVPDPFSDAPDARLYRTGDAARYLPDGAVEYLGRLDQQVKLRGFRIELGEIEAVLRAHPAIRDAVVTVRGEAGEARLVAYVVPEEPLALVERTQGLP